MRLSTHQLHFLLLIQHAVFFANARQAGITPEAASWAGAIS